MIVQAYHGSSHKFDEFSFKKMGKSSGNSGAGFGLYFSDIKADALGYGDYIYTCRLELENNVSNESITFDKKMLLLFLDKLNFTEDKNKFTIHLLNDFKTDTEIIAEIVKTIGNGNIVFEILSGYGYDHTIDHNSPELEHSTHYIVYALDAIEIVKRETLDDI